MATTDGLESPKWAGLSDRRKEAFERAVNVSTAGTTLVQNYVNKIIQQITVREFGALGTLDRKPGSGSQAIINRRAGASMANTWVADTASLTDATGSYTQATFTYRTLATRGKVSRKMRAIGRSYVDVLADEMTYKLDDFNNQLESALFVGDSGASGMSKQIDGMLTTMNAVSGQVVAQTSAVAGDSLTLAKLDATIDAVKGSAGRSDLVIYGSYQGIRKLNAALQSQQRFMNETEISAGFRVRTYDGIPMVVSTGMPDDMTWSGSDISALDSESSNPTTALLVVNKRYCWIEELTPTTMMPLARDTSQYEQFDIFWDGAFVLANTKGGAILGGIAAS